MRRFEAPAYAVVDLKMPKMSGLDVVKRLHASASAARIVVLTGYGSISTGVRFNANSPSTRALVDALA